MTDDISDFKYLMSALLGGDSLTSSVWDLQEAVEGQPAVIARLRISVRKLVGEPSSIGAEADRVLLCRVVAALLPDTIQVVTEILDAGEPSLLRSECQFALLVALSDVLDHERGRSSLPELLGLIADFLRAVDNDVAKQAWMAGDLLGDHWPLESTFPILIDLAETAERPAGRRGALHGLHQAALRNGGAKRIDAIVLVGRRAVAEEDEDVRRYASSILRQLETTI